MKDLEESTVFLSEKEGREYILNWERSVNVYRQAFHGSTSYNGNNAEKLLDNADSLEKDLQEALLGEDDKLQLAMKFVQTLKDFRAVVHSCFGMRLLDPEYETYINNFSASYRALNISVTVKVHLVEKHLVEFLKMFGETHALGFYSEQAMESFHNESVVDLIDEHQVAVEHPKFGEKLVNVMVRINGKHI